MATKKSPKSKTTKKAASKKSSASKAKSTPKKTTAKKAVSKKTAAKKSTTKKAVSKKTAAKKSSRKVSTKAKKAPRKTAKSSTLRTPSSMSSVTSSTKPVVVRRRSSWMVIITSMILLVAAIGGMLYSNPQIWADIQANLLSGNEAATSNEPSGMLISRGLEDENAQKLQEIFATVFPDIQIVEYDYRSEEGQNLMAQYGLKEVPNIVFEKSAFEQQTLAPVVQELFQINGESYILNTSLVNPSNQLLVGMSPQTNASPVTLGQEEAPVTMYVYSEPKCQHCRAMEQNNLESFAEWVDAGLLRLIMMDLPQSRVGMMPSEALHCMNTVSPENYLAFREELFSRPNLTDLYTKRSFENISGQSFDDVCPDLKKEFADRQKLADQDGITGIPAVVLGQTGGQEWLRFTGSSEGPEFYEELILEMSSGAEPPQNDSPPADDEAEGSQE